MHDGTDDCIVDPLNSNVISGSALTTETPHGPVASEILDSHVTEVSTEAEYEVDRDVNDSLNDDMEKRDSADAPLENFGGEDTDEDDDTVNVIIKPYSKGSIYKTGATYQARSQSATVQGQKTLRQGVNINDPGSIQGVPTIEFSISSLGEEEKPWKRPGADITDYFNYGFTEDTWIQYCEKQKILRQEYANTALKPVVVGAAASFGMTNLSSSTHRGGVRYPHQQSHKHSKDINVLGGRGRSHSNSDEDSEKQNGFLGPGQVFSVPPPGYAPPSGGDALSQFNNVASATAFSLPPPGFTNTSVPPPVLGSGFSNQQAGHQWPQSSIGSGLISLFSGTPVRSSSGRNHHSDSHRDRTPENIFSDEEYSESRRARYRLDEEQEGRYDRDKHRSSHRSRSRSRDRHYSGRSRRHHEESVSSRDYSRHGDRSSRRRASRERRRDRSRDRDHSLAPSVNTESNAPSRSSRGEARRRGDRESRRSHHHHRHSSRHRSPSQVRGSQGDGGEPGDTQAPASIPAIDPLEAASAAAADISEKIRRANAGTNEAAVG
uniref:Pre-mRNA 3'-end-processing factor FIP1 n=1 Tax=Mesocestoides corti TaxID=53468 RepID=A0A5K3FPW7_MESCO